MLYTFNSILYNIILYYTYNNTLTQYYYLTISIRYDILTWQTCLYYDILTLTNHMYYDILIKTIIDIITTIMQTIAKLSLLTSVKLEWCHRAQSSFYRTIISLFKYTTKEYIMFYHTEQQEQQLLLLLIHYINCHYHSAKHMPFFTIYHITT